MCYNKLDLSSHVLFHFFNHHLSPSLKIAIVTHDIAIVTHDIAIVTHDIAIVTYLLVIVTHYIAIVTHYIAIVTYLLVIVREQTQEDDAAESRADAGTDDTCQIK